TLILIYTMANTVAVHAIPDKHHRHLHSFPTRRSSDLALGQHVGLAAEAADALDATDEAGPHRGPRTRELVLARALRHQPRDLLVDRGFHPRRIDPVLDRGHDVEIRSQLRRAHRGADAVHQPLA